MGEGNLQVRGAPEKRRTISQLFQAHYGAAVGSMAGSYDNQTRGGVDPKTGKGKASAFFFLSACAAEVEVDTETGKVSDRADRLGGGCGQGDQPQAVPDAERRVDDHVAGVGAVRGDGVRRWAADQRDIFGVHAAVDGGSSEGSFNRFWWRRRIRTGRLGPRGWARRHWGRWSLRSAMR